MVQLPDTPSIPKAPPGPRLPALKAPQNNTGAAIESAVAKFAQVNDEAIKTELRVMAREDTIRRQREANAFNEGLTGLVTETEDTGDFADPDTLKNFGAEVSKRVGDALAAHTGSPESNDKLALRLEEMANTARSKFAAKSVAVQRKAIAEDLSKRIQGITAMVLEDPTKLEEGFMLVNVEVDESADGMLAEDEIETRDNAQRELVLTAVDSYLNRGDPAAARTLLGENPDAIKLMTGVQQRALDKRITTQEREDGKVLRETRAKLRSARIAKGADLTLAERMRAIGQTVPEAKQSPAEKRAGIEAGLGRPLTDGEATKLFGVDADASKMKPQSPLGKLFADRESLEKTYGAGSDEVAAINEAIESEGAEDKPTVSDISGMRKEFTKQSAIFIGARTAFEKIQIAASSPETVTAAQSISIIFSYMKMLDPESSVREGEQATAESARGVPETVINLYNKFFTGTKLTPNQVRDFLARSQDIFSVNLRQQQLNEEIYSNLAVASGFPVNKVVLPFTGQPAKGVETLTKPPDIPRYRLDGTRVNPPAKPDGTP